MTQSKQPEKQEEQPQEAQEVQEQQEEKDPLLEMLPQWVEFYHMTSPKETAVAVTRFFGTDEATPSDFKQNFGIDLNHYQGFYLETGMTDAPEGPLVPGTIKPILVLKESRSGKSFTPFVLNHDGFFNPETGLAWVDAQKWDDHVDDTFSAELAEKARKERERQEREARHKIRKQLALEKDKKDTKESKDGESDAQED